MTEMTVVEPLVLRKAIRAPRERVFAAWIDPDSLRRWYPPAQGWEMDEIELDPRPGGRYRWSFGPAGKPPIVFEEGTFQEFDPPARLVLTQDLDIDGVRTETLLTVEFLATADGTEVVVTQSGYTSPDAVDLHRRGWTHMLASLARAVEPA